VSYIGSTPTTQSFISGTDSFNGTGSATNFTLTRSVNSTNDIQVVVNNVVQYPPNYSVSGTTLTISPAPSSGTNNVYARYLSTTLQSIAPSQGSSIQFGTGSAALPSISFIGDTNTGIYSPAADTIAFVEGGTEAMRLDSSANLQFNSGYGSVATAYGCRAWVNFNGTGTVAIRASGNVSSITDNGVGNYTINFTTALVDGNYSIAQTLSAQAANNDGGVAVIASGTTPSTTSFNMVTDQRATGEYDPTIVCFSVFR